MKNNYGMWRQFFKGDLEYLTDDDLTGIDLSSFYQRRMTTMDRMFKGCTGLKNPNLSKFSTSGVTSMASMFEGCTNLQKLNLSTFDFRQVGYMKAIFRACDQLEEVLLSDTIYSSLKIPRYVCPYTVDELNQIYRDEYIACGPQLADMRVERLEKSGKYVGIPFGEATQEEIYDYLGLRYGQQKITIVPHRAL